MLNPISASDCLPHCLMLPHIVGPDVEELEESVRMSKNNHLKSIEKLHELRENTSVDDSEERDWTSLNSRVQDFLQKRKISKKVFHLLFVFFQPKDFVLEDLHSKDESNRYFI